MPNTYRIGHQYRDTTRRIPEDEFINWLDTEGITIGTTGGIRSKRFNNLAIGPSESPLPAVLVLVTRQFSHQYHNPWEDLVDYSTGQIFYWGDAKFNKDRSKKHNHFRGNKILESMYDRILEQNLRKLPPILHFVKDKKGYVKFSGLCAMEKLDITWYEDRGNPIKNFRARLAILDIEEVELSWLNSRALSEEVECIDENAPKVWKDYITGNTRKLQIWKKLVKERTDQLPESGSDDEKILEQVRQLEPNQFEKFCTALLRELSKESGVQHSIEGTRYVADGGLDFGKLIFQAPLHYEISFKGEAKRYSATNPTGPKDVSRLVARLQRGEYGIFITTSYFTKAAQEEVIVDNYPVRLFSGRDIVLFLRVLGLVVGKKTINSAWLENAVADD